MIDPDKCSVKITLIDNGSATRAAVEFKQDRVRLGGFWLKEGPHGIWLDPPKVGKKWTVIYFDEDKERYKRLQQKAIDQYYEMCKSTDLNNVQSPDDTSPSLDEEEIDLSDLPF